VAEGFLKNGMPAGMPFLFQDATKKSHQFTFVWLCGRFGASGTPFPTGLRKACRLPWVVHLR
jgi:hypothetical protein